MRARLHPPRDGFLISLKIRWCPLFFLLFVQVSEVYESVHEWRGNPTARTFSPSSFLVPPLRRAVCKRPSVCSLEFVFVDCCCVCHLA